MPLLNRLALKLTALCTSIAAATSDFATISFGIARIAYCRSFKTSRVILLFAFVLIVQYMFAQEVVISGTIKCQHRGERVTQGAERVIVKPLFDPSKSVLTISNPSGYFELKTGRSYRQIKDSSFTLVLISNCSDCDRYSFKNLLISRPDMIVNQWRLEKACEATELPVAVIDTFFTRLKRDKATKEKGLNTTATSVVAAPSFFNLLTKIVVEARIVFPADGGGKHYGNMLGPGRMHYGDYLAAASVYSSSNSGFNFAPDRDVSEVVFWNPAVISSTFKESNLSAFSNFRNMARAQLFNKITTRLSSGIGFLYSNQEEFRMVQFWRTSGSTDPDRNEAIADSIPMKLREYAIYTSLSYSINSKLSAGASLKFINQNFTVPLRLNNELSTLALEHTIEYIDSSITKKGPELDIAFNYNASYNLQVGINFMNLLGTKINTDSYVPNSDTAEFRVPKTGHMRRVGIGVSYKLHRLHVGSDIILGKGGIYDISLGANFIPFNKALLQGSYSFRQNGYTFGLRLNHFKISYINDNGYMINDRKQPKNGFFDGRIYAGLVIDGWDKNS